jgi:hypothetical protein
MFILMLEELFDSAYSPHLYFPHLHFVSYFFFLGGGFVFAFSFAFSFPFPTT